eukprot:TRINITY_DN7004_c0_g1_i15.p1 TRINITY_DN7004_c0_g1~~TRINITY_DN7004_c0_g1_i15.p1  ORF type:complete len:460 (+),score=190.58 TRINITY_DN7004_c0_g1_i15:1100-2479(+)
MEPNKSRNAAKNFRTEASSGRNTAPPKSRNAGGNVKTVAQDGRKEEKKGSGTSQGTARRNTSATGSKKNGAKEVKKEIKKEIKKESKKEAKKEVKKEAKKETKKEPKKESKKEEKKKEDHKKEEQKKKEEHKKKEEKKKEEQKKETKKKDDKEDDKAKEEPQNQAAEENVTKPLEDAEQKEAKQESSKVEPQAEGKPVEKVNEDAKVEESVEKQEEKKDEGPSEEDKSRFYKTVKSFANTIQEFLPREHQRSLFGINKEFLQLYVSRLIDQIRKLLVDNEKAISSIPADVRDGTREEADATFELPKELQETLEKTRGSEESIETVEGNEKDLFRFAVQLGEEEEIKWEKAKEVLKEKCRAEGLGQFLLKKLQNFSPSDKSVYCMKKCFEQRPKWIECTEYKEESAAKAILPALKEAVRFAGLENPTSKQMYSQLQYLFDVYSEDKTRIVSFGKALKLTT